MMRTQPTPSGEDTSLPMTDAVRQTQEIIQHRSGRFRNMVVGVVLVPIVCAGVALVMWSWQPLLGVLFLVPLCAAFLLHDAYLVQQWQEAVLRLWRNDAINLDVFAQAMKTMPRLPERTLHGMLGTLPVHEGAGRLVRQPSLPTRAALARVVESISACQVARQGWVLAGCIVVAGSLIGAAWQATWEPLVVLLVLVPGGMLFRYQRTRALRRLTAYLAERTRQADFEQEVFQQRAARIEWAPLLTDEQRGVFIESSMAKPVEQV